MDCFPHAETEFLGSDTEWQGNCKKAEWRKALREKPRVKYNGKNRDSSDFFYSSFNRY